MNDSDMATPATHVQLARTDDRSRGDTPAMDAFCDELRAELVAPSSPLIAALARHTLAIIESNQTLIAQIKARRSVVGKRKRPSCAIRGLDPIFSTSRPNKPRLSADGGRRLYDLHV
jgi:hypothetical protein